MKIEDKRKVNAIPLSSVNVGESFELDSRMWMRIGNINGRTSCVNLATGGWFYFNEEEETLIVTPINTKVVIE